MQKSSSAIISSAFSMEVSSDSSATSTGSIVLKYPARTRGGTAHNSGGQAHSSSSMPLLAGASDLEICSTEKLFVVSIKFSVKNEEDSCRIFHFSSTDLGIISHFVSQSTISVLAKNFIWRVFDLYLEFYRTDSAVHGLKRQRTIGKFEWYICQPDPTMISQISGRSKIIEAPATAENFIWRVFGLYLQSC